MEIELLEQAAIYAVLIPGTLAALALFILPTRARQLSLAVAYFVGDTAVRGWPGLPPASSTQWLPWIALVVAALATLGVFGKAKQRLQDLLVAILLVPTLVLILAPAFRFAWEPFEGIGRVSLIVLGSLIFWFGIRCDDGKGEEVTSGTALLVTVATGISIISGIAGSVVLAQSAAVLATVLAADLFTALVKGKSQTVAAFPQHLLLLAGLFAAVWYFAEAPATAGLILAGVPWLAFRMPRFFDLGKSPKTALLVTVSLALALIAVAGYLTVLDSPPLEMEF